MLDQKIRTSLARRQRGPAKNNDRPEVNLYERCTGGRRLGNGKRGGSVEEVLGWSRRSSYRKSSSSRSQSPKTQRPRRKRKVCKISRQYQISQEDTSFGQPVGGGRNPLSSDPKPAPKGLRQMMQYLRRNSWTLAAKMKSVSVDSGCPLVGI